MWIVRLALRRPYTFIVVALLMLIFGGWFTSQSRKDIFPDIDIPVISVIWTYQGLSTEEFDERITTYAEYALSANVNDIQRIESQTLNGVGVIKLYFHPSVEVQAAVAQSTAISQAILHRMPPGIDPPIILRYFANSVPIIQMNLSSESLTEQQLYDYGIYRIRQNIAVIQGTTLPAPYGGKVKQAMVDLDPKALQAKGLSPRDVNDAILAQVLTLPTGDVKIGTIDYRVDGNNNPIQIAEMNNYPIKMVDGVVVYLRDVGHAHDGFQVQQNIVRTEGLRSVLLTLLKNGPSSTIDIINQLKAMLPSIRAAAPKGMNINLLFDQSVIVKAAIRSVLVAGGLAALLTGGLILMFLGSWRSTLIVFLSIPLSIMTSIIFLILIGETLNVMTLGGLALAIGILVDDATVTIENIHANLAQGKPLEKAVIDGSFQIAIPAFVSTLAICIVFAPVILLTGVSKYLFVPFAYAVVFAVMTSYFLSRTLVPVLTRHMLVKEVYLYAEKDHPATKTFVERYIIAFETKFFQFRDRYSRLLDWVLHHRAAVLTCFILFFGSAFCLVPFIGRDFFPVVDTGQFRLHVRAPVGTRIEVTEEYFGAVEAEIKQVIPPEEISLMIDNMGVPSETYNLGFGDSSTIGTYDGEILVSLNKDHKVPTAVYMKRLRERLPVKFPGLLFYFQSADMVSQILNFGLPCPIDVRVIGYKKEENLKIARELVERISDVPGAVDVYLHQVVDAPELFLDVDRTKLIQKGMFQRDLMNDVLITYHDSTVVTPNFWLDRQAGIPYLIGIQTPKYRVNDMGEFLSMPVSSSLTQESELLCNLAKVERKVTPDVTTHYNIQPVFDVFANVQGRDLGGVSSDIQKIANEYTKKLSPGNEIQIQGMTQSMQTAFTRLGLGFIFALVLIYFVFVINFQSWLDPFIVIMALPGGISGVVWALFLTQTTFSVPSLMGLIMTLGVATTNSVLIVTFAGMRLGEGHPCLVAVRKAGESRLRPILMTALAMIVGMIPMALGIGEGGEQNAPLGRAVVGGLIAATATTLFFVPIIYSYLRKKPNPYIVSHSESQ